MPTFREVADEPWDQNEPLPECAELVRRFE